ncbi:MAG: hypothetical protein G3W58_20620 [Pantoea ananatis]|uniref:hypothetical protein n=1 Tax=Pantoea TaxID=53335 RepID=UPI000E27ACA1|nr:MULTISPECIES: hypothetical protein [Pantoea]MCS4496398.1 hypothetical protein [Pantoea sp. B623]NEK83601.1 hypothetical protein [Pantoea ananatis]REF09717.1 hypothetical protein C7428_2009 [Pantoea ananatis]
MTGTNVCSNAFFQLGLEAIQQALSDHLGKQIRLQGFYFPTMQALLAWSMNPRLAKGCMIVIAGSNPVLSVLSGLVDPKRILLSDAGESRQALMEKLYIKARCAHLKVPVKKEAIYLTRREVIYMRAFIQGKPHQSHSKRDSGIRLAVMKKIGATGPVSLLIRFRLLRGLKSDYLLKPARLAHGQAVEQRGGIPQNITPTAQRDRRCLGQPETQQDILLCGQKRY